MTTHFSDAGKDTTRRLVEIESKNRITSRSIGEMGDRPELLKQYLESSIANTFSELLFRLTHEIYTEDKATELWRGILAHRNILKEQLARDVGMLVAALDYLTNISGDILNPKIIDDLQLEAAAGVATRDSLTGLYVRGVFDYSLNHMVQEHHRHHRALSLLLLDIDDFKKVNDLYGHQAGDDVLRVIGKTILDNLRKTDFPARYGGEEIAVILPQTSLLQAIEKANALCDVVRHCYIQGCPSITVSIGVACILEPELLTDANQLVRQADKALYIAKCNGKNKVASVA
ncbi:GGDEF domain-containing protein [Desulfopila sp. IMCC35008]|uniref:GGDEF domain-containing protein n=1 Tax=Desulfopila sp. IMCC35008 TaxID=2653858 RepID=UPI0013D0A646|nr:GGDEF domain-containing protein [Desulfopila sp. IMCC35008]